MKLRPLRPHQHIAFEQIEAAIAAGEKRIIVQAPCGFGKTLLAGHVIASRIDKNERVAFVAPRVTLIDQSVAAFGAEGFIDVGVIQGRHPLTNHRRLLQIASRDTLTRRELPKIDLFIIDEVHMQSKALLKLLASLPDVPVIGLSATPWTSGLGRHFNKLIVAETTQGLIEKGYLTPFKTYAPAPEPDLSGVSVEAGEYNQRELSEAVDRPEIVGDIVMHWLRLGENRSTFCFGVDRAHAKHICQRFNEAGVTAEYLDAYTNDLDRHEILDRYKRGVTRVLCNVGVLAVGVDAPWTGCIIDAKPVRSLMLYVQTIGRGLRTYDGKTDCIVLDHAGNTLRNGLVTDIIRDDLCDGSVASRAKRKQKEKATPLPRLCDDCKSVIPQHIDTCPQCGATKIKITKVRAADGELVEFGSGQKARTSATIEERARFYAELRQMGIDRGRKPGWAANTYKERFGVWPNDPRIRYAEPRRPSLATINFVRQRANEWREEQRRG